MFDSQKQNGVAALFVTLGILLLMTIITFFTARIVLDEQKLYKNTQDIAIVYNAAQAGFDFALGYLNENPNAVTDGQVLTGTLSNGAAYSALFTYSPNNQFIQIKSTGSLPGNNSTRVVTAIVKRYSSPIIPMTTKNGVVMFNFAIIQNLIHNHTIHAGSNVLFSNSASTYIASGKSSYAGHIAADVMFRDSALTNKTIAELDQEYLGRQITEYQNIADIQYNYSGSANISAQIDGNNSAGKVIYVNMNGAQAIINSNTIAANLASPTVIVVNGSVTLSNNAVINGDLYATGTISMSNSAIVNGLVYSNSIVSMRNFATINGALVSCELTSMVNNAQIIYNRTNLDATDKNRFVVYGIVSGSWRDF